METHTRKINPANKALIFIAAMLCANVAFAHVSIGVGIGVAPGYYGPPAPAYYAPPPPSYPYYGPSYYAPPPGVTMSWVPDHWEYGYWVPGHYVQYTNPAPGPDYIWIGGGWDHHHHWHNGHWHER